MRKTWLWLGLAVVLAVGLYVAYPYYTLDRLGKALDAGDQVALETLVDWPSVRAGLKADIAAAFADAIASAGEADEPAASFAQGLATLLGPVLIDRAVDGYLTPAGVARLVADAGRVELPASADPSVAVAAPAPERDAPQVTERLDVTYAFFTSPDTFRVDVVDAEKPQKEPLVAIFRLQGATWRLTRLILPGLDREPAAIG